MRRDSENNTMTCGIELSWLRMLQITKGLRTIADHENTGGRFDRTASQSRRRKNLATRYFGVCCFSGKILSIRSHPFLLREEFVL